MSSPDRVRETLRRYFAARNAVWILAVIVLAVGAYRIVQAFAIERIAHAQVRATPFTLKLDHYDFHTSPSGRYYTTVTRARRSDGAMVDVGDVFGRTGRLAGATDRHIRMPDGETFTVHDFVAGVTEWPAIDPIVLAKYKRWIFAPPADCAGLSETRSGFDTILGYRVVVLTQSAVKGTRVTVWRAPDLLCEALQNRVEEKQADDSFKVVSEGRPVAFTLGEPDPALFAIPSNYTVLKPSEAMHEEAAASAIPWADWMQNEGDRLDGAYSRNKRQRDVP